MTNSNSKQLKIGALERALYDMAARGALTLHTALVYGPQAARAISTLANAGFIERTATGYITTRLQLPPPEMPAEPFEVPLNTRITRTMAEAISAAAEAKGVDKSEIVRDILGKALGVDVPAGTDRPQPTRRASTPPPRHASETRIRAATATAPPPRRKTGSGR